jgi:hypothetical protein
MTFELFQRVVIRSDLDVSKLINSITNGIIFCPSMADTLGKRGMIVDVTRRGNYEINFDDKRYNRNEGENTFWIYHKSWLVVNEVMIVEED